jgi:hypothetical protein
LCYPSILIAILALSRVALFSVGRQSRNRNPGEAGLIHQVAKSSWIAHESPLPLPRATTWWFVVVVIAIKPVTIARIAVSLDVGHFPFPGADAAASGARRQDVKNRGQTETVTGFRLDLPRGGVEQLNGIPKGAGEEGVYLIAKDGPCKPGQDKFNGETSDGLLKHSVVEQVVELAISTGLQRVEDQGGPTEGITGAPLGQNGEMALVKKPVQVPA